MPTNRLKKIRLKNFKSHKETVLEFDQFITFITGSNNSGKTNILRALKILLLNKDWPESYLSYGTKESEIEVEFTNGDIVKRKRTKHKQEVEITKGNVLQKFEGKKETVSYIEAVTGIKKVTLDKVSGPQDLNFIDVNSPPMFIGEQSDTVQRKVAALMGTGKVEELKVLYTKKFKALSESKKEKEQLKNEMKELVSRQELKLKELNDLNDKVQVLDSRRKEADEKIRVYTDYLNVFVHCKEMLQRNKLRVNTLVDLMSNWENSEEIVNNLMLLQSYQETISSNKNHYNIVSRKIELIDKLSELNEDYTVCLVNIELLEREAVSYKSKAENIEKQKKELEELKQKLDSCKVLCPKCGEELE